MELVPYEDPNLKPNNSSSSSTSNLPWQEMFRSASVRKHDSSPQSHNPPPPPAAAAATATMDSGESQVRLALYIAMNAGLVFTIFTLYAVYKLLEAYLRPIQWAVLCSIPLRGIQQIIVSFWTEPLQLGLTETVLAIPVAVVGSFVGTLVEIRVICRKLLFRKKVNLDVSRPNLSGFSKLLRWLLSFGVFVIAYEQFGVYVSLALVALGFVLSFSNVDATMSKVSSIRNNSARRTALLHFSLERYWTS